MSIWGLHMDCYLEAKRVAVHTCGYEALYMPIVDDGKPTTFGHALWGCQMPPGFSFDCYITRWVPRLQKACTITVERQSFKRLSLADQHPLSLSCFCPYTINARTMHANISSGLKEWR